MKARWVRTGAVTAGAVLAVALIPGTAHAATDAVRDPRGDAPRAADITKLRVSNGPYRVKATITLAHPRRLKKLASTDVILKTKDSGRWKYVVSIVRNDDGVLTNRQLGWQRGDDPSSYRPLVCDTITSTWLSRRKLRIAVPVSCLTETTKPRVKASAAILARVGPGHDSYDEVTRFTPYLRRG